MNEKENNEEDVSVATKFIQKAQKLQEPILINYTTGLECAGGMIEEFDEESISIRLQEGGVKGKTFHLLVKRKDIISLMYSEDEWKESVTP